jgi:hypothetical protein
VENRAVLLRNRAGVVRETVELKRQKLTSSDSKEQRADEDDGDDLWRLKTRWEGSKGNWNVRE